MFLGGGQLFAVAERSDQDAIPGFVFHRAGFNRYGLAQQNDLRPDLVRISLFAERASLLAMNDDAVFVKRSAALALL